MLPCGFPPQLIPTGWSRLGAGLLRVLGLLAWGLVAAGWAGTAGATETEPTIASVRLLDVPAGFRIETDGDVMGLLQRPGRPLESLKAAPHQAYRDQWYELRIVRDPKAPPPDWFRLNALQRRELDAYLVVDSAVLARATGGYARVSGLDALATPDFLLSLQAWKGAEATILLRNVATERFPFLTRFSMEEDIRSGVSIRGAFMFFYAGAALILIVYQAFLFGSFRERASIDYLIFSGLTLSAIFMRSGYIPSLRLSPGLEIHAADLTPYLRVLTLVAALRMVDSYLELKSWRPALAKAQRWAVIAFLAAIAGAHVFGPDPFHLSVGLGYILTSAWLLCLTTLAVIDRKPAAGMFLIAWSGLAAGVLYTNLSVLGWIPVSVLLPYSTPFAMLWEMVFNTIGLSLKYRQIHRERQQAQLRALEVAGLSRLVRVVCHDISNPLMVIGLAAERLRMELGALPPEGKVARMLFRLDESTAAITAIIKDVRTLERLRIEGGSVPVERLEPAEAVDASLAALQEDIEAKQLTIESVRPPKTLTALANRGYLVRNVLANILTNAVKFSPPGGRITVAVEGGPDHVDIRCSDQGEGMPEETRLAVESSLPVTSRPGTQGEGGTGFGLQLARDFTRAMGGELVIRTTSDGSASAAQGTTIIIRLRAA